jgi:hypothetical protein
MRERLAVSPIQYRRVSHVALASLTLIVLTGSAVRLTDRGSAAPSGRSAGARRCRR